MKNPKMINGIHHLINANNTTMVDGTKWIVWALNVKRQYNLDIDRVVKIAYYCTN